MEGTQMHFETKDSFGFWEVVVVDYEHKQNLNWVFPS
jgi:hypothetical protein